MFMFLLFEIYLVLAQLSFVMQYTHTPTPKYKKNSVEFSRKMKIRFPFPLHRLPFDQGTRQ